MPVFLIRIYFSSSNALSELQKTSNKLTSMTNIFPKFSYDFLLNPIHMGQYVECL